MPIPGLRDRLKSISSTSAVKPERAARPQGVLRRTFVEDAPEGLYRLTEAALHRIGIDEWPGIEKVLFLDTETTGLNGVGTVAFLVGIGYIEEGRFTVEQFMMRDYPDEAELLELVARAMEERPLVVSFNGKTFDIPLLRSRFTLMRMQPRWREPEQLDLLHPARRLWKRRLLSCKLTHLEERILGRVRQDDLPGSEVPERFFEYMKTGDMSLLEDVLEHNRLDILSLGALLEALHQAYQEPSKQMEIADLYSMGRAMERIGEPEEAIRCYQKAGEPRPIATLEALKNRKFAQEANWAASLIHRRRGEWELAEAAWREMVKRRQLADKPLTELAKYYEHRRRDYEKAMEYTEMALQRCKDPEAIQALTHRRERLAHKVKRQLTEE